MPAHDDQFVSEPIRLITDAAPACPPAAGEPVLTSRFIWRQREYEVDQVLEKWKESGPCRNGSRERYLRKHWYAVKTKDGARMQLYFERQPRSTAQRTRRWWLYSISQSQ